MSRHILLYSSISPGKEIFSELLVRNIAQKNILEIGCFTIVSSLVSVLLK